MARNPRTYVKSLTMHLGPATVRGRLKPIKDSAADAEGKTKYCSPDGKPVDQVYRDEEGKIYEYDDLGRATVDDEGGYHMVDFEALAQAKDSPLPSNIVNLTIHRKRDTERWLWPSNHAAYIFEPVIQEDKKIIEDPANIAGYNFIREVVLNPEFDVVTYCNIRNSEAVFKLTMYKGYIAVQRQLFPEALWQCYEEYDAPLDARTKELAQTVAESLAAPFNTEAYKNQVIERVKAVTAEDFDPASLPAREAPAAIDLAAQLEAFLEGQTVE